ncbi:MAG: ATP-binding protein [Chitinophagaceae bacterium]
MEHATTTLQSRPVGLEPEKWIFDLLNNQLGAVIIYKPVWQQDVPGSSIIDFEETCCNENAQSLMGLQQQLILINEAGDEKIQTLFQQLAVVWSEGTKLKRNFRRFEGDQYYQVIATRISQGVLAMIYDITEQVKTQAEKEKQVDLVNSILNATVNGLFAMEALLDDKEEIIDFRFLKINRSFARLLHATPEEIIGKSYQAVLPATLTNGLFALKCEVVKTGKTIEQEIFYAGDGIDRWYHVSISPLGKNGIVETFTDITDSKKDKENALLFAQRLHTVISTSQSGVHLFKPEYNAQGEIIDFRIVMVNKTIGDYIGQTTETLAGALASTYFPAYKNNGLFEIYRDTFLTGESRHFDFHYEDGYDVFFNLLVVKLDDELMVTLTDHTALNRMQRELMASIAELKRSNASLEQFAHAASHDLQDPLRKIIFYTDKLLAESAENLDDSSYGMLERIRTSGKRMHRLIQDLLVFAEVGANHNSFETVNLNALMDEVLADLEVAIAERDATVQVSHLCCISGDSLHLQQLFQNLIGNSLKYSRADVAPVIHISSSLVAGSDTGLDLNEQEKVQQYFRIELKDNGQGFSDEEAGQIFKIFQRLPQHRHEHNGTGIGLAIVQRVVQNHKGFITANGIPGEGATFTVYLPAV